MVTATPVGGSARISVIRKVPAARPTTIAPTSSTRPPNVVTTSAWMAARLLARRSESCPIRRKEKTVVSSQNT